MSEKKPAARREFKVAIGLPPQANLLPPEVGLQKEAARARGRAIVLAILALGVAIVVAAGANVWALQRAATLESARADTSDIINQQGEFIEVRAASQQLQSSTASRIFATSTEVSVKNLIEQLGKKLPGGSAISSYQFDTATPLENYDEVVSPLEPDRMARFTLEIVVPRLADADTFVRAAPSVEGIVDASITIAKIDEVDGTYTVQIAVYVSKDALLHRFDDFEPEVDAAAEEEPAPEETPAPTKTPVPTETPAAEAGTNEEENGS